MESPSSKQFSYAPRCLALSYATLLFGYCEQGRDRCEGWGDVQKGGWRTYPAPTKMDCGVREWGEGTAEEWLGNGRFLSYSQLIQTNDSGDKSHDINDGNKQNDG